MSNEIPSFLKPSDSARNLERANMIDLRAVDTVDIEIDSTGTLWVNVDGRCLLRIGAVHQIQFTHQPTKLNRQIIMQRDGVLLLTDNYGREKFTGVIPTVQK